MAFQEGKPLPYRRIFSESEFARLRKGLIPRQMEDKWFIYFEDPYLFFHRSWTGHAFCRLKLSRTAQGAHVFEAFSDKDIAKNSKFEQAYLPLLLDFLISNLLLGESKPFPVPSDIKESLRALYQHSISGTGYPAIAVVLRKPWWRFW